MKKFYAELVGMAVFVIYLLTLAPTVVQIDSGELAAVQATLGIAHPTGYPLFTMLGYLFLKIPLGFSNIFMSNLLASIYCAVAVVILIKVIKQLLDKIEGISSAKPKKKLSKNSPGFKQIKPPEEKRSNEIEKILASIFGGLSIAFSKTFWLQSTSVEVYSLHMLLISAVLLAMIKAFYSDLGSIKKTKTIPWLIVAFLLALSFTNHMTTLLILPALAYLYFKKEGFIPEAFKKIIWMLLIFFPVLIAVYSYLPLRALSDPLINWGNPIDFERFLRHFTGKQYQVWLFSSTESAKKQLEYFFTMLPVEYFYSGLVVALVGLTASFRKNRTAFFLGIIMIISTVAYSINYDINDIDSYFLLAFIAFGIFAGFGFYIIIEFLQNRSFGISVALFIFTLLIGSQLYGNFSKVDQSEVYIFEDYTYAILDGADENAIILSYQWDYFLSQSYYYQFVENYRRDIAVVDKELLRRSWYFNQLENCYPGILAGLGSDIEIFLNALKPFERGENHDSNLLETYYRKILTGLIEQNIKTRPVYIGPELIENELRSGQLVLPEGYTIVPENLLFRVVPKSKYVEASIPDFEIRVPANTNFYSDFIVSLVGKMLTSRAFYELQNGNAEKALLIKEKILELFPNYRLPVDLQNINLDKGN